MHQEADCLFFLTLSLCVQVERWPYRKLKSIEKLLNSVEEQRVYCTMDIATVIENLQKCKQAVLEDPEVRFKP